MPTPRQSCWKDGLHWGSQPVRSALTLLQDCAQLGGCCCFTSDTAWSTLRVSQEGLQSSGSGGKGIWSTGSVLISPPSQRTRVCKGQPNVMNEQWLEDRCHSQGSATYAMGPALRKLFCWELMGNISQRNGRSPLVIGLPSWWRGLSTKAAEGGEPQPTPPQPVWCQC